VKVAEEAFLLPLEAWMAERGVARAFFVAHSLGGYLATALWLRSPERVAGLALLSPAGWAGLGAEVPLPIMARPGEATAAEAAPPPQPPPQGAGAGAVPPAPPPPPQPAPAAPRRVRIPRCLFSFLGRLWDAGATPMALMRALGPCGLPCVRASLRGRASRWLLEAPIPPATLAALGSWLFHQLCAPPSGEAALSALLAPGAWAREPLIPRLRSAATAGALQAHTATPCIWLYGDYDWMSVAAGEEGAGVLRAAGWKFAECRNVHRAGHHLYLEAPTAVNAAILEAAGAVKV
jgi:cardiolipin-specific phospholipase